MPVYVDDMKAKFGRMVMCHLTADTEAELHAMADKIGVARKWYQTKASAPHYDIALSKRSLAVQFGAIEITWRESGMKCREWRNDPLGPFRHFPEWLAARGGATRSMARMGSGTMGTGSAAVKAGMAPRS